MLRTPPAKSSGQWCLGEFTHGVIFRFFLLFVLWLWYSVVPHKLPFGTLWVATGLFLVYDIWLFTKGQNLLGAVMAVPVVLNALLAMGINPFFFILVVFACLILDIMWAPTK